jgi:protein-S-isoprenylcysteine O-methyltransferase Ste14
VRRAVAAGGSSLFFALAPGTFAGFIPWWVTRWHLAGPAPHWWPARAVGALVVVIGGTFLIQAFARFVIDGLGTPAPIAPTQRLVVTGVYRYVRNPMYLAVTACIVGQSLLFGRLALIFYAAAFLAVTVAFVHLYEEPTLSRQFPADYAAYRSAVPGWWPRRHPYDPPQRLSAGRPSG